MKKPAALELETLFRHSISMSPKQDLNHERADRHFKVREQQKADAPKATADYYAGLQRIRDRTQELRRLENRVLGKVAEGVGFEPTLRFPVNTLSKRAPSATRPPLHINRAQKRALI
jgi:hypothetical protein